MQKEKTHQAANGNLQLLPRHTRAVLLALFLLQACLCIFMKKLDQFCSLYPYFVIKIQFYSNRQYFNVKVWLE